MRRSICSCPINSRRESQISKERFASTGRADSKDERIVGIGEEIEIFRLSARLRFDRLFQAREPAKGLGRSLGGLERALEFHFIGLRAAANAAFQLGQRRFGDGHAFSGSDQKNPAALAFGPQAEFGELGLEQLQMTMMRAAKVLQPFGIADFVDAADRRLGRGGLTTLDSHAATSRAVFNSPVSEFMLDPAMRTEAILPINSDGPLKCTACM